jgi:hypothetical protein
VIEINVQNHRATFAIHPPGRQRKPVWLFGRKHRRLTCVGTILCVLAWLETKASSVSTCVLYPLRSSQRSRGDLRHFSNGPRSWDREDSLSRRALKATVQVGFKRDSESSSSQM